ncbi:MAG: hypothetical protein WD906_01300 [Anaerolineales bacterium]
MRGRPVSRETRKADLVLVAARYAPSDGRLKIAQAYQRRGPVWGDLILIDRPTLMQALESRRKVYAGRPRDLSHDFEMLHPIGLERHNGDAFVRGAGSENPSGGDSLGVPLF